LREARRRRTRIAAVAIHRMIVIRVIAKSMPRTENSATAGG
jgi:hypothetical protein